MKNKLILLSIATLMLTTSVYAGSSSYETQQIESQEFAKNEERNILVSQNFHLIPGEWTEVTTGNAEFSYDVFKITNDSTSPGDVRIQVIDTTTDKVVADEVLAPGEYINPSPQIPGNHDYIIQATAATEGDYHITVDRVIH